MFFLGMVDMMVMGCNSLKPVIDKPNNEHLLHKHCQDHGPVLCVLTTIYKVLVTKVLASYCSCQAYLAESGQILILILSSWVWIFYWRMCEIRKTVY